MFFDRLSSLASGLYGLLILLVSGWLLWLLAGGLYPYLRRIAATAFLLVWRQIVR